MNTNGLHQLLPACLVLIGLAPLIARAVANRSPRAQNPPALQPVAAQGRAGGSGNTLVGGNVND